MSCKKGGFVTIRHNDLHDLTANLPAEVCKHVDIESKLLPVTGETFENRTASANNKARVDIKSRGFSERGQQTFFDVRVFDLAFGSNRYLNKALPPCHIKNEKEKKRQYNERVLETDHGSFTPPSLYSQFMGVWEENVACFHVL